MSVGDVRRDTGGQELRKHLARQLKEAGYGLPPVMTVAETARFMRVSKSKLYESLRRDPNYRDLYEKLTGKSLRDCPVCHAGHMVAIAVLPAADRAPPFRTL